MHARTALITAALLTASLAACSGAAHPASSKPASSQTADSIDARCHARHWPLPMPDEAGKKFDPLSADLQCFNHITALAPDGHDVLNDAANETAGWIVTSSRPGAGSRVGMSTRITLELRASGQS